MSEFAAIPTMYNGVQFRSRLEARWAAFFDLCGWQWEYEPFDLNGWIPDFMLRGDRDILVEVKPIDWSRTSVSDCTRTFPDLIKIIHKSDNDVLICGQGFVDAKRGHIAAILVPEYAGSESEQVWTGLHYEGAYPAKIHHNCESLPISAEGRDDRNRFSFHPIYGYGAEWRRQQDVEFVHHLTRIWNVARNATQWKSPTRYEIIPCIRHDRIGDDPRLRELLERCIEKHPMLQNHILYMHDHKGDLHVVAKNTQSLRYVLTLSEVFYAAWEDACELRENVHLESVENASHSAGRFGNYPNWRAS